MKQFRKSQLLPLLTLLCGMGGFALRLWLGSTTDGKGFVLRGHVSLMLLAVLTAGLLAVLYVTSRKLKGDNEYHRNFPASVLGSLGTVLAALALGISSFTELSRLTDRIGMICTLAGLLSAAALLYLADCRWRGRHPNCLCHVVLCGHMMLRLVCLYRGWSTDPELMDYAFELMALVCIMIAAFERAAFDAGSGNRCRHGFFSLAGAYFCCVSLAGQQWPGLYAAMGLWLLTNLCSLEPEQKETVPDEID